MDKYEQIRLLGEGSYGRATLVQSRGDQTYYVIKEVRLNRLQAKERESAEQEVKLLSSLDHPFIISYIESFQENGYLYIVMEYADGGDLSKKIEKQNKKLFTEEEILHDFIQIALAIKYIHDRKILHRDLKGENIFLMKNGQVKLGDFGIARVLENSFQLCQTQIGTPYYLSPEICEGKPYNSKTDIWSLGCILYELCTLKHAFNANNMNALIVGIIRGKYLPISSMYSNDLKSLVDKMLTKNARNRPSINQILSLPFIRKRIVTLLEENNVRITLETPSIPKPLKDENKEHIEPKRPSSVAGRTPRSSEVAKQKKKVDPEEIKKKREADEYELFMRLEKEQIQREAAIAQQKAEEEMRRKMQIQKQIQDEIDRNEIYEQYKYQKNYNVQQNYNNNDQVIDTDQTPYSMPFLDPEVIFWKQKQEANENKRRVLEQMNGKNPFLLDDSFDIPRDLKPPTKPKPRPESALEKPQKKTKHEITQEERRLLWEEQQRAARMNKERIEMYQKHQSDQPDPRKRAQEDLTGFSIQQVVADSSNDIDTNAFDPQIHSPRLLSPDTINMAKHNAKVQYQPPHKAIEVARSHLNKIRNEIELFKEALEIEDNPSSDEFDEFESARKYMVNDQEINFPTVNDGDSLFYRAEMIRATLENQLGMNGLDSLKAFIMSQKDGPYNRDPIPSNYNPQTVILAQQLLILEEALESINM